MGKLSAAVEIAEDARGHLYAFHRLSGSSDLAFQGAVRALRDAGHMELADEIDDVLVGRDVVADLWTFQIVDHYDHQYYAVVQAVRNKVKRLLSAGQAHVHEAEMKQREQTDGTI